MKKTYEIPAMNVKELDLEDVLTVSGVEETATAIGSGDAEVDTLG